MPIENKVTQYSYYSDIIDKVLEDPEKYKNSIPNIEQLGNKIYNESSVRDTGVNNYLDEAKKAEEKELKKSRKNAELYGFIPGEWLPDWVKSGYNNSIEGLGYQIATGQSFFNIGTYAEDPKDYPILEDIGSTVMSFMTLTDMGTILAGGGLAGSVANIGYKKAAQQTVKGLIKNGITKGLGREGAEKLAKETVETIVNENKFKATQLLMNPTTGGGLTKEIATKIVETGAKKLPDKIMSQTISGAGGLGFYSGIQSTLGQQVNTGDISAVQVLKDTAVGAGLGGLTAGSGQAFGKYLTNKLGAPITSTQKFAHETAIKALETAEFGIATPLLEGRVPEAKDFAHAAGVIGSLKVIHKIPSTAKKLAGMDNPTYGLKEASGEMAKARMSTEQSEAVWKSKKGVELKNVTFDFSDKKGKIIRGKDVKTDKDIIITEKEFKEQGFARDRSGMSIDKLTNSRRSETFGRKKTLNISDSEFRDRVEGITGKKLDPKKNKTGYSKLSHIEQIKLLDLLRKESLQKDIFNAHKAEGYDNFFIPKSVLFSKVIPFMQVKNRVRTKQGQKTITEINEIDARSMTISGTFIQDLKNTGVLYTGGRLGRLFGKNKVMTNEGEIRLTTEKKAKAYAEDLGKRLDSAEINPKTGKSYQLDVDVVKVRKILNKLFYISQKAGLDVSGFRENYFPHRYKQKYIDILGSDINKILAKDPAYQGGKLNETEAILKDITNTLNKEVSLETKQILEAVGQNLSRETGVNREKGLALAFMQVRDTIFGQRYAIAGNIERERTVDLPKSIKDKVLEYDARLVLTKYVSDAAKRISQVEKWGKDFEIFESRVSELSKLQDQAFNEGNYKASNILSGEIKLLNQAVDSFTNMIEVNPSKNWESPIARKWLKGLVDFEVGTKIGLGYATIPNITQTFISTAVRAGYWNTFKGAYNLVTNPEITLSNGKKIKYKDLIGSSGISQLSVFQMVSGLEPSSGFFGKFADGLTRASGFQGMNKINQMLAAATGREYVKNLIDVANGKGTGLSRFKSKNWAKDNLKELGLPENIKELTKRQDLESMYRFSRDTQLQRNILNDPLIFNDPRFRPLFLFKRFGLKQFNWVREQVARDVKNGNIMPILRLGVGGAFGGSFVIWSKKKLNNFLAGEDEVFDENRLFLPGLPPGTPLGTGGSDVNTDMSKFTWGDFFDLVGSVGAFGFIGDILANEDKIRAVEFLFKPAIGQDADKFLKALQSVYKDINDYGIGVGTAQRSIKYFSPIFGTAPRRLAQQFQTKGQEETYVKYRRGIVRGRILDYLLDGNNEEAGKTISAWNRTYPEKAFFYDDIGAEALFDRLEKKYKKRLNP